MRAPHATDEMVVVVPDYAPSRGGTTTMALGVAREAAAAGVPTTVLTQRLDRSWPRHEDGEGVTVTRVGPAGRNGAAMKGLVGRVALELLRHRRAGVVVLMYPDFAVAAWLVGAGRRTCMVWAGHGDAHDALGEPGPDAPGPALGVGRVRRVRRAVRALRRAALNRVSHVALSAAIEDELAQVGIRAPVHLIPTPVDREHFRPPTATEQAQARAALAIGPHETVVVYTGHLRALKRVDRVIDAFARLRAEGLAHRLLVVGGSRADLDDTSEALRAQVQRLGLDDAVQMTGALDDVRPCLWASDVFVLASEREGLSTSLLEAMACGLPAVAPASAAGDQILDPSCGIVPPGNDVDSLADALGDLCRDADRRRRLGRAAVQRVEPAALPTVARRYRELVGLGR